MAAAGVTGRHVTSAAAMTYTNDFVPIVK